WHKLGERIVERRDAYPVRLLGGAGSRVAGRDGSLRPIRSEPAAESLSALERSETASDEKVIPTPAVLIHDQDRLPRRPHPRSQARRLKFHQCYQAVDLGFVGDELGQDTAKAERLLAERWSYPVVAGGRRVALVEDEIDHLEH